MTENKALDYAIPQTNVRVVSGNESGRQSSYIDNLTIDAMNQKRKTEPFYRSARFLLYLFAQLTVCFAVLHIYLLRGSLPEPHLLIALLLFSAFIWLLPRNNPRQTYLYLAVQSLLACLLFTQDWLFMYLFLILTGQVIVLRGVSTRASLIWVGVFVVITFYGNFHPYTADLASPPLVRAVMSIIGFTFSGMLCGGIARTRRDQREIEHLLTRLQEYADQSGTLAVAEERSRLARELHDTLGHRMTVSIVQLEGASRLIGQNPRQAAGMIETVRAQLTDGLTELRDTLTMLRNHNYNADSTVLIHSLQQISNEFAVATGITVHIDLPDMLPSLSDTQYMTIYRVVQEGLTNVQKHGQSLNVWVNLGIYDYNTLLLNIRNDGRDFDSSNGSGYGLQGMRERAAQLGGTLHTTIPLEGGTLLTLRLPIQESREIKGE